MKGLTYPKITIILAIVLLLVSVFLTNVFAASSGMTLNVKNQLRCQMEFAVTTTISGGSSFGASVYPGETYTITLSPLFGTILSSIKAGPAFGPTYYNESGLGLSGEPFTIILDTSGVTIQNNSYAPIHRGSWTGGPCPN